MTNTPKKLDTCRLVQILNREFLETYKSLDGADTIIVPIILNGIFVDSPNLRELITIKVKYFLKLAIVSKNAIIFSDNQMGLPGVEIGCTGKHCIARIQIAGNINEVAEDFILSSFYDNLKAFPSEQDWPGYIFDNWDNLNLYITLKDVELNKLHISHHNNSKL